MAATRTNAARGNPPVKNILMNTRDIGLALRDFLEEMDIFHFDEHGNETEHQQTVETVDVSDPHNPVIWLDNGQRFLVHIVADRR